MAEKDDKAAVENMKAAQEAAEGTARSFQEQLRIMTQMRDVMNQVVENMKSLNTEETSGLMSPETLDKVIKKIEETGTAANKTSGMFKKLSDFLNSRFAKSFAFAGGFVSGLKQGFSNILAIGRGTIGFFVKLADVVYSTGRAILSIPLKIMEGLINMAKSGGGGNELFAAYQNVIKQFGDLNSEASRTVVGMAKGMGAMKEYGVNAYRVFGNLAQRLEYVNKLAGSLGPTFNAMQTEFKENANAILLYQKGLDISDEQLGIMSSRAVKYGVKVSDIQKDMTKYSLGMAKSFGINAKILSRDMAKGMADLAHFGHLSTKEMQIAATFANKMGLSIEKLTGLLDATKTYEQTAEGIGKLNEQFGLNIDYGEIMAAENPAQQMDILKNAFHAAGKDISTFNRYERDLIKQGTNLDDVTIDTAFSAKNAGVSYSKMAKEADKLEKKTLTQTDALKELAKSIEKIPQSGGAGEGGIFQHFIDGITRGMQSTSSFMTLMRNINIVLRNSTQYGVMLGRKLSNIVPGLSGISDALNQIFDPKKFNKMFEGILKSFDVFGKNGSGKFEDFMDQLQKNFFGFLNAEAPGGKKALGSIKEFFGKFVKFAIEGLQYAWRKFKGLYDDFIKELSNPGETTRAIVKSIKDGVEGASKFIKETFVPFTGNLLTEFTNWLRPDTLKNAFKKDAPKLPGIIGDAFSSLGPAIAEAGKKLEEPVKKLVGVIMVKFKEYTIEGLKEAWSLMPWWMKAGIITAKIGPAIGNGILAAWSRAQMAKAVSESIAKSLGQEIPAQTSGPFAEAIKNLGTSFAGLATRLGLTAGSTTGTGFLSGFSATVGGVALSGIVTAAFAAVSGVIAGGLTFLITERLHKTANEERQKWANEMNERFEASTKESFANQVKFYKEEIDKASKEIDEYNKWSVKLLGQNFNFSPQALQDAFTGSLDNYEKMADRWRARATLLYQLPKVESAATAEQTQGTAEWVKKNQEEALKQIGPITIDNAEARFKKINDLAKQVTGSDFAGLNDKMKLINAKLSSIDFTLMDESQRKKLGEASYVLETVQKMFANIADIGGLVTLAGQRLTTLTPSLADNSPIMQSLKKDGSLHKALNAVGDAFSTIDVNKIATATIVMSKEKDFFETMNGTVNAIKTYMNAVKGVSFEAAQGVISNLVNTVRSSYGAIKELDGLLNQTFNLNLAAKLQAIPQKVGMAMGEQKYTINDRSVVINASFTVYMEAAKIEKVLVNRHDSIIRDRINYAIAYSTANNRPDADAAKLSSTGPNDGSYAKGVKP
jgi:hypothetical protein